MPTRRNFALSTEQRNDARAAYGLIGGRSLSLTDCARIALQLPEGARDHLQQIPIGVAIAHFLDAKLKAGVRSITIDDYERKLKHLEAAFADYKVNEISQQAMQDWLDTLPLQPAGRRARWLVYRSFFSWAVKNRHCSDRILSVSVSTTKQNAEIEFLSVEDVARLVANANPQHLPAFALSLFAGIRPYEVCALKWENIDFDARIIRIPAAAAKTRRARIIEGVPETLWHFLKPGLSGPITNLTPNGLLRAAQVASGHRSSNDRASLRPWPNSALRHTFATYHVALTKSAAATALILGHSSEVMLHRHYRGLATEPQAKAFFALAQHPSHHPCS